MEKGKTKNKAVAKRKPIKNADGTELLQFNFTLENGRTVSLEAPKDPRNFSIKMVLYTKRKDYVEFMFGALTEESWNRLEQAGAKFHEFEELCAVYGDEVVEAWQDEDDEDDENTGDGEADDVEVAEAEEV